MSRKPNSAKLQATSHKLQAKMNEFLVQKKLTPSKPHWWKKSPKPGANSFKPRSTVLFHGEQLAPKSFRAPGNNKFFADETPKTKHSWRTKIIAYVILIFLLLGVACWGLFYSKSFSINDIKVDGTKYLSAQDISVVAWNQTKNHRWLVIPQNTLFGLDVNQLIKQLTTNFKVNKIIIKKELWHNLDIHVQERPCVLVWLETGHYYCLDQAGEVINVTDQAPAGLPLVANQGLNKINGSASSLAPSDIAFMVGLEQALPGQQLALNLKIKQYFIDNQLNTVNAQIDGGPLLLFNPQNSLAGQLLKLKSVAQQDLHDQLTKKKYIDLRFGDKAFISPP